MTPWLGMVAALVCGACVAGGAPAEPAWALVGVVATAERGTGELRVLVRDLEVPPVPGADPVWLHVADDVEIVVQRRDGTLARGSATDVVAGARIAALHTGVELRSLPPRYTATRVRILLR